MGIVLVRVDDRLLHGQVMEAWLPFCRATSLIVANDEAAGNPVQKMAIQSCASKGMEIKVRCIDESVSYVKSKDSDKEKIVMIISSLKDAIKLYSSGIRFSSLNIGNIHHNGDGMSLSTSVYIDSEDMDHIMRFQEAGVKIDIRAIPSDKAVKIPMDKK
ncbi:MAG: PTS sugar transporter subunit IIB [Deltaproteobacteria bacterium]|nr:PTS sugar transporter subunit IIB [Deltaproteobacteria bacterium]